jgi:hypothetical protein
MSAVVENAVVPVAATEMIDPTVAPVVVQNAPASKASAPAAAKPRLPPEVGFISTDSFIMFDTNLHYRRLV